MDWRRIFQCDAILSAIVLFIPSDRFVLNRTTTSLLRTLTRSITFRENTPLYVLVSVISTRSELCFIDCTKNEAICDDVVDLIFTRHTSHLNVLRLDYCQNIHTKVPVVPNIQVSTKGCWKIIELCGSLPPEEIVECILCGINSTDPSNLKSLFVCWHTGFFQAQAWYNGKLEYNVVSVVINSSNQMSRVVVRISYMLISVILFRRSSDTWWRVYMIEKGDKPLEDDHIEVSRLIRKLLMTSVCN